MSKLVLADPPSATKVQTRYKTEAKILAFDPDLSMPLLVKWKDKNSDVWCGCLWQLNADGTACGEMFIENTPEPPVTVERWCNVFPCNSLCFWANKADAVKYRGNSIACVPVQITYRAGEGLEQ